MATDLGPGPVRAGEPGEPGEPGGRRELVEVAVVLGALAVVAAAGVLGGVPVAFGVVAVAAVAAGAHRLGFRGFVLGLVVLCATRPLLDLTATERGTGVSPTELFGVGSLALLVGWLFRHRQQLLPRLSRPLPLALLSLALVQALSTLGGAHVSDGVSSTLRVTAGVALFLVVDLLLVQRRITLPQVGQLVLLVAAPPLVYPVLGLVGVPVTHVKDGVVALKSVFFLSNNFAHFLVPVLVLAVAWALRSTGVQRVAAVSFVAVTGVALVQTETRGAWLGAVVGVGLVTVLLDRRVALAGAVVVVVVAVAVPTVNARLADLGPRDEPYSESSLGWRIGQWERLLPEAKVNPVLGTGPGQAVHVTGKEAHNDYVKAVVETGVVGLAVYLWFLIAAVVTAWRAWRRVRRPPGSTQPLLQAAFAGVAAYSVAIAVTSAGENLVDNLTFLWTALPLLAAASWATTARDDDLTLEALR